MKYGVMCHRHTHNIGDDIQTYAASRFMPRVDYLIDRETIRTFESDDDEPVALCMSSWYMWDKWNWPPNPCIIPKFVGFNYSDKMRGRASGDPVKFEYLEGLAKDYMDAHGPIGCRDYPTLKNLEKLGYENLYFSGCITLTLDPPHPKVKPEKEYICLVDLDKASIKKIKKMLSNTDIEIKVIEHTWSTDNDIVGNETWEQRKKRVEDLLDLYANAKCVVTFRLHCLLPCTAMETPVLLLREGTTVRFKPYQDWVHYCTISDFLADKYEYDFLNPPKNPDIYKETRNKLIEEMNQFVKDCENETRKASEIKHDPHTKEEYMAWRHDVMVDTLHNFRSAAEEDRNILKRVTKERDMLQKQLDDLTSFRTSPFMVKTKNIAKKILRRDNK